MTVWKQGVNRTRIPDRFWQGEYSLPEIIESGNLFSDTSVNGSSLNQNSWALLSLKCPKEEALHGSRL
jgi:hypothetical protein